MSFAPQIRTILSIFVICIFIGILTIKTVSAQGGLLTQDKPPPPFVGCVDNGDWLCMCYFNGDYVHDCANYESGPKKDNIALCGGDAEKGEAQWRWNASAALTGKGGCCGGRPNACGLDKPTPLPIEIQLPTEEALPTNPPIPTKVFPTARLLPLPSNEPIQFSQPTVPLLPSPDDGTTQQQPTSSFTFATIQFPHIVLPTINPVQLVIQVNTVVAKPLMLFENLFLMVQNTDIALERFVNQRVDRWKVWILSIPVL